MLYFDQYTNRKLVNYCIKWGFDLNQKWSGGPQSTKDFDFHITVAASKNDIDIESFKMNVDNFYIFPKNLRILGDNLPVLELETNRFLRNWRNWCIRKIHMQPTFPKFIPHVTLSYKRSTGNFNGIPLPDFPLNVSYGELKDFGGDSEKSERNLMRFRHFNAAINHMVDTKIGNTDTTDQYY